MSDAHVGNRNEATAASGGYPQVVRFLILSGSERGGAVFSEFIHSQFEAEITIARSGGDALMKLEDAVDPFDFVLVNPPLAPDYPQRRAELAEKLGEATNALILFVVSEEEYEPLRAPFREQGVLLLKKPISKQTLLSTLEIMQAVQTRMGKLSEQATKLQEKLEDMKLITRAKLVLMQNLNMTENAAHKYLEKQAMDLRARKRDVAINVLKLYDNPSK
ncbi:MAG: ANTAR domain-containing protein [Oscillospiraceae bacterium]|jgi:response regulator NasT|nr:ANTAR domain-containing protein [Oscillospiraceae bacterium]